jgi:hypothetical protein
MSNSQWVQRKKPSTAHLRDEPLALSVVLANGILLLQDEGRELRSTREKKKIQRGPETKGQLGTSMDLSLGVGTPTRTNGELLHTEREKEDMSARR